MVLDQAVEPLRRVWCLFELLQTFLIRDDAPHTFEGLKLLTSTGVLNSGNCSIDLAMAIGRALASLDLQDARASNDADKELIFSAVRQEGGFQALNSKLTQEIGAIMAGIADKFEQDLQEVRCLQDAQADPGDVFFV